jgi:hypothetical protein
VFSVSPNNQYSGVPARRAPEPSPSSIDLNEAFEFLTSLAAKRFFGVVTLSWQAGQLLNVRSEQSFKSADIHSLVAKAKELHNGRNSQ